MTGCADTSPLAPCGRGAGVRGLLAGAEGEVHATFADGSPAAISWKCGRGEVLLLAGTPEWERAAGLFRALYHWAGGRREVRAERLR